MFRTWFACSAPNAAQTLVSEYLKKVFSRSRHFAHTILSQAHLTPLPIAISPVYWPRDHSLQLHPLPDLLVIADQYDPYTEAEHGCYVINPGSFPSTNFAFKVYIPATNTVEDSIIPDV